MSVLNQIQVSEKVRLILTLNTGEVIERDVEGYDPIGEPTPKTNEWSW